VDTAKETLGILCAGVFAVAALLLLLIGFGVDLIAAFALIPKPAQAMLGFLALALVYVLGTISDSFADAFFGETAEEVKQVDEGQTLLALSLNNGLNPFAERFFEYLRMRKRLLQNALLSSLLLSASALLALWRSAADSVYIRFVLMSTATVFVLSWFALRRLKATWQKHLSRAWAVKLAQVKENNAKSAQSQERT
jgi:hypothetical protein